MSNMSLDGRSAIGPEQMGQPLEAFLASMPEG